MARKHQRTHTGGKTVNRVYAGGRLTGLHKTSHMGVGETFDYLLSQQASGWPSSESIHSAHGKPKDKHKTVGNGKRRRKAGARLEARRQAHSSIGAVKNRHADRFRQGGDKLPGSMKK